MQPEKFDAAAATLRSLIIDRDDPATVANAKGSTKGEMARDLLEFLEAAERAVRAAGRPEQRIHRVGAHGSRSEGNDLPPGCRLVPREG